MRRQLFSFIGLGLCSFLSLPGITLAHAFGQRYDLPIPLPLFIWGASVALVVSFVLIALFQKNSSTPLSYNLSSHPFVQWLQQQMWLLTIIRLVVFGIFLFVILTGFLGNQEPLNNFASTFFWIIFWIGLPLTSALIGNIWEPLNPWSSFFRLALGKDYVGRQSYPKQWGIWPAVVFFTLFTFVELVFVIGNVPANTAFLLLVYSLIMWAGALIYGATWLSNAEFFSVLARTIGASAPLGTHNGKIILRIPGTGLLELNGAIPGFVAFVGILISGVLFDGLKETLPFAQFTQWVTTTFNISDYSLALRLGIVGIFGLLLLLFALQTVIMRGVTQTQQTYLRLYHTFMVSLIPIGVAYTIAHYYSYLFIQGQRIIALISDPFGVGSNYLGTADYRININLLSVKFLWYSELFVIVVGHIIAVYVAHLIALRFFQDAKLATKSQIPMMIFMIALTVLSLSILSSQLTNG